MKKKPSKSKLEATFPHTTFGAIVESQNLSTSTYVQQKDMGKMYVPTSDFSSFELPTTPSDRGNVIILLTRLFAKGIVGLLFTK